MKETAKELIKRHEGYRSYPYTCTAGKITIGYGHNLTDNGISEFVANLLFNEDFANADLDLRKIFGSVIMDWMPKQLYVVLINMSFQLGEVRFRSFKKLIQAVIDYRVDGNKLMTITDEMRDSLWYRQVPGRAEELIEILMELF